jgi:hypothetical protein
MKTASTIWTLLWNLPTILALIGTIREAFQSERVQEALATINELIAKICPPAPTAESGGKEPTGGRGQQHSPVNPDGEKRRRWLRFRNRINVAQNLSDAEAHEFCVQHNINLYELA